MNRMEFLLNYLLEGIVDWLIFNICLFYSFERLSYRETHREIFYSLALSTNGLNGQDCGRLKPGEVHSSIWVSTVSGRSLSAQDLVCCLPRHVSREQDRAAVPCWSSHGTRCSGSCLLLCSAVAATDCV